MIGLAISCLPLNTLHCIQNLQFTSAPWSNTPRKQFNKFKHTISWSMPSILFFEACWTCHFMKHAKHDIYEACQAHHFLKHTNHISWSMPSMPFYEAFQACEHAKFIGHASMPSIWAHLTRRTCRVHEHISTLFGRLSQVVPIRLNIKLLH